MSIVFKDSFYNFDKNKYYDKVLNKAGISKKIDINMITKFLKDILKQYNNLYSISSGIEKYLSSKRNQKLYTNYKKSLLMIESNFRFIEDLKIFEHVFDREVLIGNNYNNRKGIRFIYDYFNNMKDFINKIDNHEIENSFNKNQGMLLVFYIFFEYHNKSINSNMSSYKLAVIENELPNIKSSIKSFINNFSKYFERASKDYKSCQSYFKNNNIKKSNKTNTYVRENVVFMLILNYENIYKCFDCIHDLIEDLLNIFKIQTPKIENVLKTILNSKNSKKKEDLEKKIIELIRHT